MNTRYSDSVMKAAKSYKSKLLRLLDTAKMGGKISGGTNFFRNIGDISDHIKVTNMIISNKEIWRVGSFICDLDTASSEQLPRVLYNLQYRG